MAAVIRQTSSSATIANSVISGNSAVGISSSGDFNVHRTFISSNGKGAITHFGNVIVTESIISGNSASYGAGIRTSGSGNLLVKNSTISGNTANPGHGGGIANQGTGTITVRNSTLSGNSATRGGGGGISNTSYSSGSVVLLNATLSGNSQQNEGGGGLLSKNGGTVSMINTVIADSGGANDCALLSSSFSANSNNLIEDGSCNTEAVNFLSGDPLLGPLQSNGGFTQTHAILPGSPLIDAGDATACDGYPTDQRGFARPQDGNDDWTTICDIGAFELPGSFLFRNGFEAGGN